MHCETHEHVMPVVLILLTIFDILVIVPCTLKFLKVHCGKQEEIFPCFSQYLMYISIWNSYSSSIFFLLAGSVSMSHIIVIFFSKPGLYCEEAYLHDHDLNMIFFIYSL